jgi:TatD DNase family protein
LNGLGAEVVDSHCHLDFKNFNKDRDAVIDRAKESGIVMMVNSGIDYTTNKRALDLATKYDFIFPTLGLSPNSVEYLSDQEIQAILDQIRENAGAAVGVGEAGLDYYRCTDATARGRQVEVFQKVIDLAKSLDLPLVIHARNTEQIAFDMVKGLEKVVFHCYSGTLATMKQAIDRGFYVSLATVVCKSAQHQVLARNLPLEHMLVETDSPFLAPKTGRNEPSYVLESIKLISRIKGTTPADVARATTSNARKIFKLP